MKLDDDDVRAIASEARLSLTDDELKGTVRFINNFLVMADRVKELDLKNTSPFCFAESNECPLREDTPEPFGQRLEILKGRADSDITDASLGMGGYFKVPRIMEE